MAYRYTDIHLSISDVPNDFLCIQFKKILASKFFFKFNNDFFSTGTPTTNKVFLELQVLMFEAVLKLQTNLMIVY